MPCSILDAYLETDDIMHGSYAQIHDAIWYWNIVAKKSRRLNATSSVKLYTNREECESQGSHPTTTSINTNNANTLQTVTAIWNSQICLHVCAQLYRDRECESQCTLHHSKHTNNASALQTATVMMMFRFKTLHLSSAIIHKVPYT